MQGSTDPINKVFSSPKYIFLVLPECPGGGEAVYGGGSVGFKPNGIKFIMFLKMSMFYIRGIIILARQRNNLRDTIMKSRDYTRRTGAEDDEGGGMRARNTGRVLRWRGARGVSVSEETGHICVRVCVSAEGCKKTNKSAALLILYTVKIHFINRERK